MHNNIDFSLELAQSRGELLEKELEFLTNIHLSNEGISDYFSSSDKAKAIEIGDMFSKKMIEISKINKDNSSKTIERISNQITVVNNGLVKFDKLIEAILTRYPLKQNKANELFKNSKISKYIFPDLDTLSGYILETINLGKDINKIYSDTKDLLDLKIRTNDIESSFAILGKYTDDRNNIINRTKNSKSFDEIINIVDSKKEISNFIKNGVEKSPVLIEDFLDYLEKLSLVISKGMKEYENINNEIKSNLKSLNKKFYESLKSNFKNVYSFYSSSNDIILSQKLTYIFDTLGFVITRITRLYLERSQIVFNTLGFAHQKSQEIIKYDFIKILQNK